MGQSWPLFVYFGSFLVTISMQIEKCIDGVHMIRTWGRRMVGADETTELCRPPTVCYHKQSRLQYQNVVKFIYFLTLQIRFEEF